MKLYAQIAAFNHNTAKFLMTLSVIFLPKVILFPILKVMSDVAFYILKKRHYVKEGPQKYNFFVDRRAEMEINKGYKFTEDNIADTSRRIERSLRSIVKVGQEGITQTDEEKNLEIVSRQQ